MYIILTCPCKKKMQKTNNSERDDLTIKGESMRLLRDTLVPSPLNSHLPKIGSSFPHVILLPLNSHVTYLLQ